MYEVFEHTADLGLRITADSLNKLFADAARGLLSVIVANPQSVRRVRAKSFELESDDLEFLLFDWLTELLYAFESQRLLVSEADVTIDGARLRAECRGEAMDRERHAMDHEVKAITYHQLRVEKLESGGWIAEVVLDI